MKCFEFHSINHIVGGQSAVGDNALLISQFKTAWVFLARDVTTENSILGEGQDDRIAEFCDVLAKADLMDVLNICMDAADLLIGVCPSTYIGFKHQLRTQHPELQWVIRGVLTPIAPLLEAFFTTPDVRPQSLRDILLFLRFGKKLSLQAIGLEEAAISAYLETEERLSTVTLLGLNDVISDINRLLRHWLRDLPLKGIVPNHGSGSVAEGKLTLYEKYRALGVDVYLRIVLGPCWPEYYPMPPRESVARVSRTVFVPKTFTKLRTISMEPATLQYFQQGIMKQLYAYIDAHPYLGRRIKLRDQTQNQEFARIGSRDNSYCTLDLKAASDSVSWLLCKRVFAGTALLKWLYVTRSKETKLPTGQTIALKKFAPMGSALCFPVQCLIFAAVIEHVSQKWCRQSGTAKPDYSVFGDDLIVDKAIVTEVIDVLEALGFTVNEGKSFTEGPFRESCGKDYYEGIDVSSVYYRLQAVRTRRLSPEVFSSLCSAANIAAQRGLTNLRRYYLSMLLNWSPYFCNTVDRSPYVWSPQPTNFHVKMEWHEDYQQWVGKFMAVLSMPSKCVRHKDDDDIAYFVRLSEMADRIPIPTTSMKDDISEIYLHGTRTLLGFVKREVDPLARD